MSKNVAVFVDVANIFYAAKAAGVDIDYVTLLKSASAGRDLVRAYAYTGLDPDNENQRNFHSFLARHGYKVVSKDIRKYGDGKVKANLDIELVVDMMKTSRNLDIAIVVSGDGDFAPAIRAVQEMGVRVEVISFRGNTSSDLIDVADQFTDIIHLAKVEKASSRSGRRVAGDDEDLSMTEVPDKQTEGVGGRGRGRGRSRGRELEPAVRAGRRPTEPAAAALTSSGAPLVVLPGEKLSRVAPAGAAVLGGAEPEDSVAVEGVPAVPAAGDAEGEGAGRRRRRRGGRGRGRGRRPEGVELVPGSASEPELVADNDEEFVEAPRGPRTTPFGSVWDSQLGVPTSAPARLAPLPDEDDLDEPEIPEYLIAERKNRGRPAAGGGAGGRGSRGNRAAYAAAMDRERFGRGGGSGGINRYPDVSARERPRDSGPSDGGFVRRDRPDRGDRPERQQRVPRPSGGEPWSEVPPELEAMLRAQLSTRPNREPAAPPRPEASAEAAGAAGVTTPEPAATKSLAPRGRSGSRAGASATADAKASPKRRTTPGRTTKASSSESGDAAGPESKAIAAAPKRRAPSRAKAAPASTTTASAAADGEGAAPKRRVTRRKPSTETPPA